MGDEDLYNTVHNAVETVADEVDQIITDCVDALTNVSEASYQQTAEAEAANMATAEQALVHAEVHHDAAYEAVGLDAPDTGDSGGWVEGNIF